MRLFTSLLAGMAVTLAGCGTGAGAPDIDGSWRLIAGELDARPIPIVGGWPITLEMDGTQLGGRSACNHYGAPISYGGRSPLGGVSIRVSEISQTLIGCEPDVMDSEAAYLEALARVEAASRSGDRLVLTGPGVRLEFTSHAE
jgi:heat shock protein HslJ